MKKIILLLALALLPYFVAGAVQVGTGIGISAEAKICPPGQFPDPDDGYVCHDTKNANSAFKAEAGNSNGIIAYLEYFAMGLAGISGGLSVLTVAFSGFMYATSEGDSKKMQQAKTFLIGAGIGIFICGGSLVIMDIIRGIVTG